jgi:FKBP-type peptidyl-prolyl cis-trans isomerase
MDTVDPKEHKKGIIGVIMFISIVIVAIAAFYIYDASKDNSSDMGAPTPTPTSLPIPSGELKIDLNKSGTGKEAKNMDGQGQVTELQGQDLVVGTGVEAVSGKKVTVNYLGTLTDGTKFDSSYDRGTPFSFNLGAGEVIQGWDRGVAGMKVGGKRKLIIPASLAYGDQGVPGAIPGGATLVFEVELLGVE